MTMCGATCRPGRESEGTHGRHRVALRDEAVADEPDRLALDHELPAEPHGLRPQAVPPLRLADEPQAEPRVRARRGVEAIQRGVELREPGQHGFEALAGPPERLGLGLADLLLDLPMALLAAPGTAHSTATSRISHRCRPRKRVMLSSVSTGATASTL